MKYLALATLAVATAVAAPPSMAGGDRCLEARAQILCSTQELRLSVWALEDAMGEPRTPTSYSDRASPSEAYRLWVQQYWRALLGEVQRRYDNGWGIVNAAWPRADDWDAVAQCETGGDWQWNSGTFQGALGIHYGAWDDFRQPGEPTEGYLASRLVQMLVAERIYNTHGIYAWGCGGAA